MNGHPEILYAEDIAPPGHGAVEQSGRAADLAAYEIDRHHAEVDRQNSKASSQIECRKVIRCSGILQQDSRDQISGEDEEKIDAGDSEPEEIPLRRTGSAGMTKVMPHHDEQDCQRAQPVQFPDTARSARLVI